eukprot:1232834-Amphidinium_carterae.1
MPDSNKEQLRSVSKVFLHHCMHSELHILILIAIHATVDRKNNPFRRGVVWLFATLVNVGRCHQKGRGHGTQGKRSRACHCCSFDQNLRAAR